jgi:hypothetical protein
MRTSLRTSTLALALLGSAAFLTTPSFAVEPDVDSPAGPELPAPRTDRPDFQHDDQSGAVIDPRTEGADPRPPSADLVVPVPPPDVVVVPVPPPPNPTATSPGEENKGKPPVAPY